MKDGVITMMLPEIEPGEEVVIKDGPLKGFTAVFEKKLKTAERIVILLASLNVRAVIDSALLEKPEVTGRHLHRNGNSLPHKPAPL